MKNISKNLSRIVLGVSILGLAVAGNAQVALSKADGWLESAYAEWSPVSGAASYNVYCDGNKVDNRLIRTVDYTIRSRVEDARTAG